MQYHLLLAKCPACAKKAIISGPSSDSDYSCDSCHTTSSFETIYTRRLSLDEINEYESLYKKPKLYREDFDIYNDVSIPAFIRRKHFVDGYEEYKKELAEIEKEFMEKLET